jgi:hypothetical protein
MQVLPFAPKMDDLLKRVVKIIGGEDIIYNSLSYV